MKSKKNPLFNKDVISVDQFSPDYIGLVMNTTKSMRESVEKYGAIDDLKGKLMTALFYEPSSRTFGSFISAMQRLGGGVVPLQGMTYSSVSKGENLPDTVRTFASYTDLIVIRHPEVGSARIAAQFSPRPVINAGDGVGEHPTQALLDMFTIIDHYRKISGLEVSMVGDLLNGRTVHSLAKLLSLYPDVKLNLISPKILQMPEELVGLVKSRNLSINQTEMLNDVIGATDVLYVTRVQKERFTDLEAYEKLKHRYIITSQTLAKMKKDAIIMHPFPRVGEIDMDVDLDRRALYIRSQMANGMYVRMALLYLILKKDIS